MLDDPEDIAHARSLVAYNRDFQQRRVPGEPSPPWEHERYMVSADIIYAHQPVGENRDYLHAGAPAWSWRTVLSGFFDGSTMTDDTTPVGVEGCVEEAGKRAIFTASYTTVAEVPLSYEVSLENGMKHGWFGWYDDRHYPWVHQLEHGWAVRLRPRSPQCLGLGVRARPLLDL